MALIDFNVSSRNEITAAIWKPCNRVRDLRENLWLKGSRKKKTFRGLENSPQTRRWVRSRNDDSADPSFPFVVEQGASSSQESFRIRVGGRHGVVRNRARGKTDFPREHYHFSWRGLRRCGDYRFEPPPRQVIKSRDPVTLLLILDCLRLVPSWSPCTGLSTGKRP